MSMPSSSALVAAMPSRRPLDRSSSSASPFLGEVPGAVRGDATRELGRGALETTARVLRDHLGAAATPREREGLVVVSHESGHELGGFDVRRTSCTRMRVDEWSLPAREHPFGARRRVVEDLVDLAAAERGRQLAGIPDGRAREEERRIRAIVLTEPAEAAQDVRDVRPEDAAQRVQLVDDDVLQTHEERGPRLVRRQDPHVQHLGVGQHDVGVLARPGPVVAGRVAVVGNRA